MEYPLKTYRFDVEVHAALAELAKRHGSPNKAMRKVLKLKTATNGDSNKKRQPNPRMTP